MRRTSILFITLLLLVLVNTGAAVNPPVDPVDTESANQSYPPGIMFSTLLDNVTLLSRDGTFRLANKMQNVFMPDGSVGKAVVYHSNDKEFASWKWKLDTFGLKPPYKLFGFQQPSNPDGTALELSRLKLNKPDNFRLDFFIGEKKFFTFPFSVRAIEPADPFDGNTIYVMDGAWNDWGYLVLRRCRSVTESGVEDLDERRYAQTPVPTKCMLRLSETRIKS